MKMYLDAGTTWSKIISTESVEELREYLCHCKGVLVTAAIQKSENYNYLGKLHPQGVRNDMFYYILPSSKLK